MFTLFTSALLLHSNLQGGFSSFSSLYDNSYISRESDGFQTYSHWSTSPLPLVSQPHLKKSPALKCYHFLLYR